MMPAGVAFAAALTGGKATGGVFLARDGKIEPVALSGAAAPDIPGGTLTGFERPVLDGRGGVAFLASVRRGRDTVDAIFRRSGGRLVKLVAAGDAAPGGGVFSGLGAPAINTRASSRFRRSSSRGPFSAASTWSPKGARGAGRRRRRAQWRHLRQILGTDRDRRCRRDRLQRGAAPRRPERRGIPPRRAARCGAARRDRRPGARRRHLRRVRLRAGAEPGRYGAFVASIDGGPSPVAIFAAGKSGLSRIAGIGDALPDGGRLVAFPRYPAVAIGPEDAVTFAAASERDGRSRDALYYYGLPRPGRR